MEQNEKIEKIVEVITNPALQWKCCRENWALNDNMKDYYSIELKGCLVRFFCPHNKTPFLIINSERIPDNDKVSSKLYDLKIRLNKQREKEIEDKTTQNINKIFETLTDATI